MPGHPPERPLSRARFDEWSERFALRFVRDHRLRIEKLHDGSVRARLSEFDARDDARRVQGPFALTEALCDANRRLLAAGDDFSVTAAQVLEFGRQLWNALPDPVRARFEELVGRDRIACGELAQLPRRVFLDVEDGDASELAFEALFDPGIGTPFLDGPLQLARLLAAPRPPGDLQDSRRRALLLLGSFHTHATGDASAARVAPALPWVVAAIRSIAHGVDELHVAAKPEALATLQEATRTDGDDKLQRSLDASHAIALADERDLDALAGRLGIEGGCRIVHYLGHSWAADPTALDLGFQLDPERFRSLLERLKARVAIVDACRSGHALARHLLGLARRDGSDPVPQVGGVDHAIVMATRVPFELLAAHCARLYALSATASTVAEAVRQARSLVSYRELAWSPRLYSRTLDQQAFLDPHARPLVVLRRKLRLELERAVERDAPRGRESLFTSFSGATYVEVHLNDAGALDRLEPLPGAAPDGAPARLANRTRSGRTLDDLVDALAAARGRPDVPGGLFVCGKPGAGKTFMLREEARRLLAGERLDRTPLFVPLKQFGLAKESDLLTWLARGGSDGNPLDEELLRVLEAAAGNGHLFFLLDGLDELPREHAAGARLEPGEPVPYRKALDRIAKLRARWRHCIVVVSTRESAYEPEMVDELPRVDALDWRPEQVEEFLQRWFAAWFADEALREEPMRQVRRAFTDAPELLACCGTPLFARLAAELACVQHEAALHAPAGRLRALDLGRTRADLYDRIVDHLVHARHHDRETRQRIAMPHPEVAHAVLRRIAVEWTRRPYGRRGEQPFERTPGELVAYLRECTDEIRAGNAKVALNAYLLDPGTPWQGDVERYVEILVERTRILCWKGTSLGWWHRNFLEAFAAEWLFELWQQGEVRHRREGGAGGDPQLALAGAVAAVLDAVSSGRQATAHPGQDARDALDPWAEPLSLLESRLDEREASALVQALLARPETAEAGWHVFSRATRIDAAVAEAVLADAGAMEGRRLQALERLPEVVRSRAALVRILARFAPKCSDLRELAAIDGALANVEFGPPADEAGGIETEVRAAAIRARFDVPAGGTPPPRRLTDAELVDALAIVPGPEFHRTRTPLWCPVAPGAGGVPQAPGEFLMGSPGPPTPEPGRFNDEAQHRVRLSSAYWIGAVPVTLGQFRLFDVDHQQLFDGRRPRLERGDDYEQARARPRSGSEDPTMPATDVDWYQACAWCRWLTAQLAGRSAAALRELGLAFSHRQQAAIDAGTLRVRASLPTEAQWEYAARAGTTTPFFCGRELTPAVAVFERNGREGPQPVGRWSDATRTELRRTWMELMFLQSTRRANSLGLFDVHGNVWEWCVDRYGNYDTGEDGAPVVDPRGVRSGGGRVVRGGGFDDGAWYCRSAYRVRSGPWYRVRDRGFRVALSLVAVPQLGGSSLDH